MKVCEETPPVLFKGLVYIAQALWNFRPCQLFSLSLNTAVVFSKSVFRSFVSDISLRASSQHLTKMH